tara:strand:+ start:3135 stop:3398 length:264 start_codon:yes stop_codon:yes gene_type:complete
MMIKTQAQLKAILKSDGIICVTSFSQDCDGVKAYGKHEFDSLRAYNKSYESFCDSVEGLYSWEVVPREGVVFIEQQCGTFGHGWDIN